MTSIPPFPSRSLKRSVSCPDLAAYNRPGSSKSRLWEWVRETPNPGGGKLILFKLKELYDVTTIFNYWDKESEPHKSRYRKVFHIRQNAAVEETARIFPAVEPYEVPDLNKLQKHPFPDLGFRLIEESGAVFVTVPDQKALEANWKELARREDRSLPLLLIDSMLEGTASDGRFIRSGLSFHGALSESEEFLHDLLVHWISILKQLYSSPVKRFELDMHFAWFYKVLCLAQDRISSLPLAEQPALKKDWEVAQAVVSAYVDLALALTKEISQEGTYGFDKLALRSNQTQWTQYFVKRFPGQVSNALSLEEIWGRIFDLAQVEEAERTRQMPPKSLQELKCWLFLPQGQKMVDPDGTDELYKLERKFLPNKGLAYFLRGPQAGFAISLGLKNGLMLTQVQHLELRPQLIDFVCHAAIHFGREIVYGSIPENWPLSFTLGFRLPRKFNLYNDLFLIDYALAMGWMDRESERLLELLDCCSKETNTHPEELAIGYVPLRGERSVSDGVLSFHSAQEICDAFNYHANQWTLDNEFLACWKMAQGGASAALLGQQRLEMDYADLCVRIERLKSHYQIGAQTCRNRQESLACQLI